MPWCKLKKARTLTSEPMSEPGRGRWCGRAASWWSVLWSRSDWRGLEWQQSWAKGTLASAAATLYIIDQVCMSRWGPEEEELTVCSTHQGRPQCWMCCWAMHGKVLLIIPPLAPVTKKMREEFLEFRQVPFHHEGLINKCVSVAP